MKRKTVKFELVLEMPEKYNLDGVANVISQSIEKLDKWDFVIHGFSLLEDTSLGDVITYNKDKEVC